MTLSLTEVKAKDPMDIFELHHITAIRSFVLYASSCNSHYSKNNSTQNGFRPTILRWKNSLVLYFIWSSWLYSSKSAPMNKLSFTNDRLFMSVVGPSGSATTEIISLYARVINIFDPSVEKTN